MSKYISIFLLTLFSAVLLFLIFASFFEGGGDPAEDAVYIIGGMIVVFLSFLITQVFYMIDLLKKRR